MIATEEGYLRGGEQETDRDYKTITLEFEGKSEEDEFRGIIFIPKRAPYDMFQAATADSTAAHNSTQLYVRRVFFSDEDCCRRDC
jgi:HSP90 family molecular chaperone